MKVLVVDDDDSVRNAVRRYLTMSNMEVVACDCAESALDQFKNGLKVDAVLSDFSMGRINGVDMIEQIKDRYDEHVPCMLFTGSNIKELLEVKGMSSVPVFQKGSTHLGVIVDAINKARQC